MTALRRRAEEINRIYESMRAVGGQPSLGVASESVAWGGGEAPELIRNGRLGECRYSEWYLAGVRVITGNGDPTWREADQALYAEACGAIWPDPDFADGTHA